MKAAFLLPVVAVADVPLTMSWGDYKNKFGMAFNGEEDAVREQKFNANIALIEAENARQNTHTLGVNQFAHLSFDEFAAQYLTLNSTSVISEDDAHLGELEVQSEIANDVDWSTDKSVVNPVKDQGQCGSCWAFSAVGTVESAYAVAAGKLGSYAEQQLVDCDTRSDGCSGGYNQYGISYIGNTGIASESGYPYTATDGSCRSSVSKALAKGAIAGYNSVGKNNAALQSAINSVPVSVTVDADNSWQLYRSGVLSQACGLFGQIDHAVIAVGYDTSASTFKIRNSWGASWGEGGYVRIANDVSNPYCLYNTAPFTAKVSADVTV
jgi:C1A family cysteine protease